MARPKGSKTAGRPNARAKEQDLPGFLWALLCIGTDGLTSKKRTTPEMEITTKDLIQISKLLWEMGAPAQSQGTSPKDDGDDELDDFLTPRAMTLVK